MAPSITSTRSRKQPRRKTQHKKKKLTKPEQKNSTDHVINKDLPSSDSSTTSCSDNGFLKNGCFEDFDDIHVSSSPCSTPKAERFQIPKIATCPPAPKKRRLLPGCSSLQRNPIAFFAPPDLELFFFFALHNISV